MIQDIIFIEWIRNNCELYEGVWGYNNQELTTEQLYDLWIKENKS